MTCLHTLDLEKNKFEGEIFFDEFFGLADTLVELRASLNNFNGPIPDVSEFQSLKKFWIANNTYIGDFPASVTALSGLGKLE